MVRHPREFQPCFGQTPVPRGRVGDEARRERKVKRAGEDAGATKTGAMVIREGAANA